MMPNNIQWILDMYRVRYRMISSYKSMFFIWTEQKTWHRLCAFSGLDFGLEGNSVWKENENDIERQVDIKRWE